MKLPILRRTPLSRLLWSMAITGAIFMGTAFMAGAYALKGVGVPWWIVLLGGGPLLLTMLIWGAATCLAVAERRYDVLMGWRLIGMTEFEADEFVLYVNAPGRTDLASALQDWGIKHPFSVCSVRIDTMLDAMLARPEMYGGAAAIEASVLNLLSARYEGEFQSGDRYRSFLAAQNLPGTSAHILADRLGSNLDAMVAVLRKYVDELRQSDKRDRR